LNSKIYQLENKNDLEMANNAVGKFYRKKNLASHESSIVFHPKKVVTKPGPMLSGEYVEEDMYLIGDVNVYAYNKSQIPVDKMVDYEEITEEEYEETKAKIASLEYIQNELNGIPNLV
jgi:hypothetical protein